MPSKYQPQIIGWIGDLEKGGNYLTSADDRLLYANDNFCAFIRKTKGDQIFYSCLWGIASISLIFLIPFLTHDIITMDWKCESSEDYYFLFIFPALLVLFIIALYLMIPEFYQNLFTRRGSPIIFNRKTGKVYVNESYFFNFKVLRHPATFLHPNKKRIKEYDWANLQGVMIHNFSKYSINSVILMECKPNTCKTIDHILLDPSRDGVGSCLVWGWINNFLCENDLVNLNDGKYKWEQETQFMHDIIKGQGWPEWMVEAFNATSLEHLTEIKQKYNINS
jgi:hypothetical protein